MPLKNSALVFLFWWNTFAFDLAKSQTKAVIKLDTEPVLSLGLKRPIQIIEKYNFPTGVKVILSHPTLIKDLRPFGFFPPFPNHPMKLWERFVNSIVNNITTKIILFILQSFASQ